MNAWSAATDKDHNPKNNELKDGNSGPSGETNKKALSKALLFKSTDFHRVALPVERSRVHSDCSSPICLLW